MAVPQRLPLIAYPVTMAEKYCAHHVLKVDSGRPGEWCRRPHIGGRSLTRALSVKGVVSGPVQREFLTITGGGRTQITTKSDRTVGPLLFQPKWAATTETIGRQRG